MQSELNKINNVSRLNNKPILVLFWLICQMFFFVFTFYVLAKVGSLVEPIYVSDSLSSGTEQYGWPFSYSMKIQDDPNGGGMDILAFLFDFFLFYAVIRIVGFVLKKILQFIIERYNLKVYTEQYFPYVRYTVVILAGLFFCYWIIYMYIENTKQYKIKDDPALLEELIQLKEFNSY